MIGQLLRLITTKIDKVINKPQKNATMILKTKNLFQGTSIKDQPSDYQHTPLTQNQSLRKMSLNTKQKIYQETLNTHVLQRNKIRNLLITPLHTK